MAAKISLKKSLIGFEVELFTLDSDGKPIAGSDSILRRAEKTEYGSALKKECGKCMLEIASDPNVKMPHSMENLLTILEDSLYLAEKDNIKLLPLGTYPGSFNPSMRSDARYHVQQEVFGQERFKIAGRVCGFHCHYTLPRGIFDANMRFLKMLINSKIKDSFVNSYNFAIAADPALTTFMQSSPFYQNRFLGKDGRMIIYRAGNVFQNPQGLYAKYPSLGALPPYKSTAFDIIEIIKKRYNRWAALIDKVGINIKTIALFGSTMDTAWNPVKVNPNGTLELRGMDMNHPNYIAGIGIITKFILKKLQTEFFAVVPSDIGIKEPFKVEGDTVYIPPFSYVRHNLQKQAAFKGLDDPGVLNYCKRFLRFAKPLLPKRRVKLTSIFQEMLDEKETISDKILKLARKLGWEKGEKLPASIAQEIALEHSKQLFKEILMTKKIIGDYE